MADKRMTKKDWFALIRAAVDTHPNITGSAKDGMIAFVDKEVELLNKRGATKGKSAKAKAEQDAVKRAIVGVLAAAQEPMKATPIGEAAGTNVQRATALLKQLVDDNVVIRSEDKGVAYFTLA